MIFDRSTVTIEKVRYHDLKDLEKIFTKEFSEEVNTEIIKQRIHRVRQFYYILLPLSTLSNWINNLFNIYILRVQGDVAGFIQISTLTSKQLHLDYIAISKKYRGQGLGSFVLKTLFESIVDKNGYEVILEVRSDNKARHLYERLGFTSQAQVLHYAMDLNALNLGCRQQSMSQVKLQKLKESDRPALYRLYRVSVPRSLQRVVMRDYKEFNPSLFVRNLTLIKNYLMRAEKQEFIARIDNKVIASVEWRSYPKAKVHIFSMLLNPRFEYLREELIVQAFELLQKNYKEGRITTTIYNDSITKQAILEKLGFIKQEMYYLMLRSSGGKGNRNPRIIHPITDLYFTLHGPNSHVNRKNV